MPSLPHILAKETLFIHADVSLSDGKCDLNSFITRCINVNIMLEAEIKKKNKTGNL